MNLHVRARVKFLKEKPFPFRKWKGREAFQCYPLSAPCKRGGCINDILKCDLPESGPFLRGE